MMNARLNTSYSNSNGKILLIRAGDSGGRLPHALLSLAANLDDETLILDEATPQLIYTYKNDVKTALCVGISTITGPYIRYSLDVAACIRAINPKVPIIWGGWHPSLTPEQTLRNEYVDHVIVGQGEQAFRDMVNDIKNGNKVDDIIGYKYINRENFANCNFYGIRNMERYITPYISARTITLYTSQGCPFGCEFCAIYSVYGKNYSGWPIEYVTDVIENFLNVHYIDGVHFDDDNFFISKKRALKFANQLLMRNIDINWSAQARVDACCKLEHDEWDILRRSGCKRLLVGAESGSDETLDKVGKNVLPEMNFEFARLCYQYDIVPCLSMMVGVPGEKMEEAEKTFKFIDRVKKEIPRSQLLIFLYTPYPGTPLFDLSVKMGFKEPQSLEAWSEIYFDVPIVPWIEEELVQRVRKYNRANSF